jgi:adenylate kinase family enzyme
MGKAIRINVVGSSGSGKTTVARQLSQALDLPHIELDALFWMADWTPRSEVEFLADITSALRAPGWVLDGNYSRTTPLKWAHVDTVIWLDLPFWQILWQSLARTLKRSLTGKQLWGGEPRNHQTGLLLERLDFTVVGHKFATSEKPVPGSHVGPQMGPYLFCTYYFSQRT